MWWLLLLAARPSASLEYFAPDVCPPVTHLVDQVAAHLGFDPFVADSEVRISARIVPTAKVLEGLLRIQDGDQKPGLWRKGAHRNVCRELVEEMALAIALALDPLGEHRAPVAELRPPPPPPPPPPPVIVARAPPRSGRVETGTVSIDVPLERQLRLGLEVGLSLGLVPAPTANFGVGVTYQVGRFELDLHVRATAAGAVEVGPRADASALAVYAELYPCYDFPVGAGFWSLCAAFGAGAFYAQGEELEPSRTATKPLVIAGARLGYRLPLGRSGASLELNAEADAAITRVVLVVGGQEIWRQPPLSGLLTLGFSYEP
ncbi:MAG: hypothetical protein IPG45_33275 [Deltaproteobacteria bacterium]|nr:hypothetical protein [Deltaproteobacteria bacterium]